MEVSPPSAFGLKSLISNFFFTFLHLFSKKITFKSLFLNLEHAIFINKPMATRIGKSMKKEKNDHPVMIKVSKEILDSFDEVVKSCRSTRSELLRQVIELFLDQDMVRTGLEGLSNKTQPSFGDQNRNNKLKQQ